MKLTILGGGGFRTPFVWQALIRDQADRCRDILRSMGRAGKRDAYIAHAPLTEVMPTSSGAWGGA